jgi:hypothetical protein
MLLIHPCSHRLFAHRVGGHLTQRLRWVSWSVALPDGPRRHRWRPNLVRARGLRLHACQAQRPRGRKPAPAPQPDQPTEPARAPASPHTNRFSGPRSEAGCDGSQPLQQCHSRKLLFGAIRQMRYCRLTTAVCGNNAGGAASAGVAPARSLCCKGFRQFQHPLVTTIGDIDPVGVHRHTVRVFEAGEGQHRLGGAGV